MMGKEALWQGIPRREVPWYPTVDLDLCIGCQACLEFCPNDVYLWDEEDNHPIVANPYNCVVYCRGCANVCTEEAISFPDKAEIVALVKELRARYGAGLVHSTAAE